MRDWLRAERWIGPLLFLLVCGMAVGQTVTTTNEVRAMRGLGVIQGTGIREQGTEKQGTEMQTEESDLVERVDANGCDGGADSSGQGAPEPGGL
jgi:hypothetical protein